MMMGFDPSQTRLEAEHPGNHDQDDYRDIASVSTETEDDPVNLAMRASLGASHDDEDGYSDPEDEEEDSEEEEQIVWTAARYVT